MNAIEIERDSFVNGTDFCNIMMNNGLVTKATKEYSCRFTPPLVITEEEVGEVVDIVERSIKELELLNEAREKQR